MSRKVAYAQKLLDEARRRFEAGFRDRVHPEVGHTAIAPTGEPYVQVVSGTIVRDQKPAFTAKPNDYGTPTYPTAEAAIVAWEEQANIYATRFDPPSGEAPHVLYWRVVPDIDTFEGRWKVYSRFLVSRKPMVK